MEIYILDPLYRRIHLFDRYESLIWTERYSEVGDFKLVIESTPSTRTLFKTGVKLGMSHSDRGMIVETVVDKIDEDGRRMLTIDGHSFEKILTDRAAAKKANPADPAPMAEWVLTGKPADVARELVFSVISPNGLNLYDQLPLLRPSTERYSPEENIPEPEEVITVKIAPKTLYDALKELCDAWQMGFRLVKPRTQAALYFEIYSGNNRTTGQFTRTPVVFSPELDNLQNTTELNTIDQSKNVAYVFSPAGFLMVQPENVPPDTEGFDRNVLIVNADDVTAETPNKDQVLRQRGLEAIAQAKAIQAFDGEINQNSQYTYGVDYVVGDLVEMRNIDGLTNQMRVTEQIFVSDKEGERSYPTLALATFVNEGSWMSWRSNRTWFDLSDDLTTWSEQP